MTIEDVIAKAVQEALTQALPDALARVERPTVVGIDPNTVYTRKEAAARLGISVSKLDELRGSKHLRYISVGKGEGSSKIITEAMIQEFFKWRSMHWDACARDGSYPQLPASPLEVAA